MCRIEVCPLLIILKNIHLFERQSKRQKKKKKSSIHYVMVPMARSGKARVRDPMDTRGQAPGTSAAFPNCSSSSSWKGSGAAITPLAVPDHLCRTKMTGLETNKQKT